MAVLKDMVTYLRRPVQDIPRRAFTPEALLDLIKLLGLAFLALPIIGLFMGLIIQVSGVTLPEPSGEFEALAASPNFIFMAAIAAPLIEELVFRSWLTKRWGVLVVMPILVVGVALLALTGSDVLPDGAKAAVFIAVLGSFTLYLSRYMGLRRDPDTINRTVQRVFPNVFWGSCFAFGLMHLANYEGGSMGLLLPLIVLPQFTVGVMLGFIRMRYGLICAMGFHGAYNTALLTVFTLLGQAAP